MNLLLNLDEYVRVVHYLGEDIRGSYDGKWYTFPDGHDGQYTDVHRSVAYHVFGFMNPDKTAAFLRLGWDQRMTLDQGVKQLTEMVRFEDIPAFPDSVVDFKKAKSDGRMATSPSMGQGGSPAKEEPPKDPFAKAGKR